MPQVFLVMRRTDIPEEEMQVVDLKPNTSQRNYVLTPPGQSGYIHNIPAPAIAASVAAGPPVAATADLTGLAAYLIGNLDTTAGVGGAVYTGAQADAAAGALVAIAQAGTVLDAAAVDAILAVFVAGTSLSGGGSTGVLSELLSVMAGNGYMIEAGTEISDGGGLFAGRVGDFVEGVYKQLYDTGSFNISNGEGNIFRYKQATFTYLDVQGAALTVYSATGTLL